MQTLLTYGLVHLMRIEQSTGHKWVKSCSIEALVAQEVRPWPADLPVQGSRPAGGRILFNCKLCSITHNLSLSPSHRPIIHEIQLKRTLDRKSSTHPFIILINYATQMYLYKYFTRIKRLMCAYFWIKIFSENIREINLP